jgi:hypothetical protein
MAYIEWYLKEVGDILERLPNDQIAQIIRTLEQARMEGRQIFIIGNGGSAATASHFANDLLKATVAEGKPRMKPIALTGRAVSDNVGHPNARCESVTRAQSLSEGALTGKRARNIRMISPVDCFPK